MFIAPGKLSEWGENMRKWHEMLQIKMIKCLLMGLLPLLAVLLISGTVTVKKITASKKQQLIAADTEIASNTEEEQVSVPAERENTEPVSRSSDVDRYSVQVLAQVIEGEAADEPYEGKVAVGAVILNRSESSEFPNSIPGVVYQADAFESVSNGQYQRPLTKESMQAAVEALNGSDPSGGALYFWNPAKATSKWVWSRPVVKQIGNHVFAR